MSPALAAGLANKPRLNIGKPDVVGPCISADRDRVTAALFDTRGQRPADFETTLKFGIALTRLAAEDPTVHKLTLEVQHLLKPRSVFRDPTLVQRVLAKMTEA